MAITVNGASSVTVAQLGDGTSADLAGNITDESGTGALVFNTNPTLSGVSLSDGSIVLEGTTANDFETTLTVTDPTADRTVTFQDATGTVVLRDSTDTLSNKTLTAPKFETAGEIDDSNGNELIKFPSTVASAVNEVTVTNAATAGKPTISATGDDTNISLNLVSKGTGIVEANGVEVTTLTGTQTLTNKTLTSPAITGGTLVNAVVKGLEEDVNVVASAATGTINLDVDTASIWYYTTNATANHTLNIRFSSGATLDSVLAVGDAVTVVWMNTNGATAYYANTYQIDGVGVTPEWQGGTAPTGGNANSIDVYSFTVIKTAATPTYVVLGSQAKFA